MSTPMEDARQKQLIVAVMTAGLCASRKDCSVEQMLELQTDVHHSIFPDAGSGAYKAWAAKKGK